MDKIRNVLAFNLKRLRIEKRVSQRVIADKCGFEVPSYSRWENAKSWPSPSTIQSLAKFYGICPTEFYKPMDGFKCTLSDALKIVEAEAGIKLEILSQSKRTKKS